ncbi:hypothetical protein CALVIDRAFT_592973 [Calocera viscosa TUFC12733]|uniref:Uncharacterized protein n=1 Tax=Calocera viscosa (strain TUFC12733) TaxID=1330018 RepID=A0A167FW47_CALVF|nr:hypothetical protein CALVIDRAFT_592973 [Calocera viscosa TUFC12733]
MSPRRASARGFDWQARPGRTDIMDYKAVGPKHAPLLLVKGAPDGGIICTWHEGHSKHYFIVDKENSKYILLKNGDVNPFNRNLVFFSDTARAGRDNGEGKWVSKEEYGAGNCIVIDERANAPPDGVGQLVQQLRESIEQDRNAMREERDDFRRQITTLQTQVDSVSRATETAQAAAIERVTELETRAESLATERDVAVKQNENLAKQLQTLNTHMKILTAFSKKTQQERVAMQKDSKSLSGRLQTLQERFDTLASSSTHNVNNVKKEMDAARKSILDDVKQIIETQAPLLLKEGADMFSAASADLINKGLESTNAILDLKGWAERVKVTLSGVANLPSEVKSLSSRVLEVETGLMNSHKFSSEKLAEQQEGLKNFSELIDQRFSAFETEIGTVRDRALRTGAGTPLQDMGATVGHPTMAQGVAANDLMKEVNNIRTMMVGIATEQNETRELTAKIDKANSRSVQTHTRLDDLVTDIQWHQKILQGLGDQVESILGRVEATEKEARGADRMAKEVEDTLLAPDGLWDKVHKQGVSLETLLTRTDDMNRTMAQSTVHISALQQSLSRPSTDHIQVAADQISASVANEIDLHWKKVQILVKEELGLLKKDVELAFTALGFAKAMAGAVENQGVL